MCHYSMPPHIESFFGRCFKRPENAYRARANFFASMYAQLRHFYDALVLQELVPQSRFSFKADKYFAPYAAWLQQGAANPATVHTLSTASLGGRAKKKPRRSGALA